MTNPKKGSAFEKKFYFILGRELEKHRLGLLPSSCQVFQGKGYFSADRNKNIIFDSSIEVTLSDAKEYSFVWLWECKDYTKSVPVDDIEEFYSKVCQVTGSNVKAGFATTSAVSSGALNFARAKKLSVIRVLPDDQIDQLLPQSFPSVNNLLEPALLDPNYFGPVRISVVDGDQIFDSIGALLTEIIKSKSQQS